MSCCTRSRYNILVLSFSFMVLFCSYNTLQNYATSLFPASFYGVNWNLANVSLAILYGSVALTIFLSPALVTAVGARATMILGALGYVVYIVSLINIIPGVVLAMSFVIGFGASILWIALGVFITQNSTAATYGSNTGMFWSIFQLCQVIGNLVTYFVFPYINGNDATLYIGFSAVALLGTLGLLALRTPKVEPPPGPGEKGGAVVVPLSGEVQPGATAAAAAAAAAPKKTCGAICRDVGRGAYASLKLLWTPRFALLIPAMFFSGMELSFWTGEFPQLVEPSVIGLVLTFAGVGEVIGGYVMGKICDWAGQGSAMLLGSLLYGVGLILSVLLKNGLSFNAADGSIAATSLAPVLAGAPLHAYAAALLFGLGDSAFNTCVWSITSLLFDGGATTSGGGGGGAVEGGASSESAVSSPSSLLPAGSYESASAILVGEGSSAITAPLLLRDGINNSSPAPAGGAEEAEAAAHLVPAESRVHSVGAFTAFQLVQNLGSGFGFFYAIAVPMHGPTGTLTQVWCQIALMIPGTILVLIAMRFFAPAKKMLPSKS